MSMARDHACTKAAASTGRETVRWLADTRFPTETGVLVDLGSRFRGLTTLDLGTAI